MNSSTKASYYGIIMVLIIFIIVFAALFVVDTIDKIDLSNRGVRVNGTIYKIEKYEDSNRYFVKFKLDTSQQAEFLITVINAPPINRGRVHDQVLISYVKESGASEFVVDSGFRLASLWPLLIIIFLSIALLIGLKNPDGFMRFFEKYSSNTNFIF